jgi:raffinose/stachyose/melibiose transport system permease protein
MRRPADRTQHAPAKRLRRARHERHLGAHLVLALYAVVVVLPLLFVAFLSFKDIPGILGTPLKWPTHWYTDNYSQAWTSGSLLRLLVNSVLVAGGADLAVLLLSSLVAFVIARYRFTGNQALFLFFMSGMALPIQLVALPVFILVRNIGLLNSLWGLVIVMAAGGMSFSVFILTNFMRGIPMDLQEAATVDGAGPLRVYWHVVLPLVRPALSIVAIFQFLAIWKEFFLPLLLIQDPNRMTVAVGLLNFVGQYSTQWQLMLAGIVIVSLPTIVGFMLVARQFRRNLMAGAVKL